MTHQKCNITQEITFFLDFPGKVLITALIFIQECSKLFGKVSNFGIHLWE